MADPRTEGNGIYPIDIIILPEQVQGGCVGVAWCIGYADGTPCFDDGYEELSMKDFIHLVAYRGGIISSNPNSNF